MVTPETFSALHRLPQDEVFHFYLGDPVDTLILSAQGGARLVGLGHDLAAGERLQLVVPGGSWQGTRLVDGTKGYALLGTTMAPGFEFSDMELALCDKIIAELPEWREWIERYVLPSYGTRRSPQRPRG